MNNKDKIVIFGAGGHGKVVLDILSEMGADVIGFIDDDKRKKSTKISGVEVLGDLSTVKNRNLKVALGIGDNIARCKVFKKAQALGLKMASAIHPKAVVSQDAQIKEAVVIMPGAVVNAGAILEDGAVVNTAATVDHDCRLERFCQVWPGAHLAGNVRVGEFSYVGTGASVIQNIRIGKNVMIGAGAVVVRDVPDDVTAVGVPARVLQDKRNG